MEDEALVELRELWKVAADMGIPSQQVAEASGVTAAAVRNYWNGRERTA